MNKHRFKAQYDNFVRPHRYNEGNLVLLYDQASEPLEVGKFNPMWHDPYILMRVLEKGAYELEYYEGNILKDPTYGLYLNKYYS